MQETEQSRAQTQQTTDTLRWTPSTPSSTSVTTACSGRAWPASHHPIMERPGQVWVRRVDTDSFLPFLRTSKIC